MNYATIKKTDVANGPGVRVSLFVSGCTHHCPGCFNAETWDFHYGKPFTDEVCEEILEALKPDFIRGFSLLGGEPFEDANRPALIPLLQQIKEKYPQKEVWCYSGYTFEEMLNWIQVCQKEKGKENVLPMLELIDVLVDGEFIAAQKNLRLAFRGSENQRVLDVAKSLKSREAVWVPRYQ